MFLWGAWFRSDENYLFSVPISRKNSCSLLVLRYSQFFKAYRSVAPSPLFSFQDFNRFLLRCYQVMGYHLAPLHWYIIPSIIHFQWRRSNMTTRDIPLPHESSFEQCCFHIKPQCFSVNGLFPLAANRTLLFKSEPTSRGHIAHCMMALLPVTRPRQQVAGGKCFPPLFTLLTIYLNFQRGYKDSFRGLWGDTL